MSPPVASREALLEVQALTTWIETARGPVRAVDGVSLSIFPGDKVALVGESGCGKTITARSILRLLPAPAARIVSGKILYRGRDLTNLDELAMGHIRGAEIGMVFQDPLTYLNPRMRVGDQIGEAIELHRAGTPVQKEVGYLLDRVGLPSDMAFMRRYPFELSGGMRQRILIAAALAARPKLLIADEPTTALDVTLQAQILALLDDLCSEFQMALVLITHDMGVVAEMCDRIYVMYAGKVVEHGRTQAVFDAPRHPYTQALLGSALKMDVRREGISVISGTVPDLVNPPPGCRFQPRCPQAMSVCLQEPPAAPPGADRHAACWLTPCMA
jgi:oligopeptide transport system ATP-binding protein